MVVNSSVSSVRLSGLSSQTQYHVSIFPVYQARAGPPLRGTLTTRETLSHYLTRG